MTSTPAAVLRMQLIGAQAGRMEGLDELPGRVNYIIGNDRSQWRTNIPVYSKVASRAVYPGVDLVYYGNQSQLEYDLVVAPGADPSVIKLNFPDVDKLELDTRGRLNLHIDGQEIRMLEPVIYQERDGVRRRIEGAYTKSSHQVGFRVSAYDRTRPLVIDPVMVYSTFLGGNHQDIGYDVAVDASGNAYIIGATRSTNFPTQNAFQPGNAGSFGIEDVFVTKLTPSGGLVYSTYLGGNSVGGGVGDDYGYGIAVDSSGNACITGSTRSANFPVRGALQATYGGNVDVFVAKLNAAGGLVFSTYLGGSGVDGALQANDIALDVSGNIYVTGRTDSTDFPTQNAFQAVKAGDGDAFVTKLNPTGTALLYSTYLGGSDGEVGIGIAVDPSGHAYITGGTTSTNFPTLNPFQSAKSGGAVWEGFVTKLSADGSTLVYSTYFGSTGQDFGHGIAVDTSGHAYVTGETGGFGSSNIPTVNAVQPMPGGFGDAFVTKFNPAGSGLVYSTFLGGNGSDVGLAIAVEPSGSAYITGYTQSDNFPVQNAVQPHRGSFDFQFDAFVTRLSPAGSAFVYSTYLGGAQTEFGHGIAVDGIANAYVTGSTSSSDSFPRINAVQFTYGGLQSDAFVAKIKDNQAPTVDAGGPYDVDEGATVTVTASGSDPEGGSLTYAWDLDHDGTFETPGESATFAADDLDGPTSRTIGVRATDLGVLTATIETTVNVLNVAPTAGFASTPSQIIQGQTTVLAFSDPSDPSAADTLDGFLYSYDCNGDGTFEVAASPATNHSCSYPAAGTFTAGGRIEDKDGGSTPYTTAVTVLTPRQGIDLLIQKVNELVAAGALGAEPGSDLIMKLDLAAKQLDKGNTEPTINELRWFIRKVEDLVGSGQLPAADGQALIACASQIIAELGG